MAILRRRSAFAHFAVAIAMLVSVDTVCAEVDHSPSLNQYIFQALENNAELKSAFLDYRATLEKNRQVSALPDPKLTYGYFIREVETRVGPQRHRVGAQQSFPWFGTLSLRGELADAEARASFYRFLHMKNRLVLEVVRSYSELAYAHSAILVAEKNIELVKSWEPVLRERFRSGSGTHSDLVRVQVELGKLEDRINEFQDLITPLEASFNALLTRDMNQKVIVDSSFLNQRMIKAEIPQTASSKEQLLKNNPELLMLEAAVEAKSKGVRLAEKKFYPDLSLGLDYVVTGDREGATDSGDDAVLGMVSFTMPLDRGKYRAGLRAAQFRKRSMKSMKQNKLNQLQAELERAKFNLRDSNRRSVLYRHTLIPKSRESLEASFTAYESGKTGFIDLLDIERELLDFELSLTRAEADRVSAAAKISSIYGGYSELEAQTKELENE